MTTQNEVYVSPKQREALGALTGSVGALTALLGVGIIKLASKIEARSLELAAASPGVVLALSGIAISGYGAYDVIQGRYLRNGYVTEETESEATSPTEPEPTGPPDLRIIRGGETQEAQLSLPQPPSDGPGAA